MILSFTIKTGILLFVLLSMVIILSYILKKKLTEEDIKPNNNNLTVEELKKHDIKNKVTNIRENTSFVPNPDEEIKSTEYTAIRKDDDDIEIL